VLSWYYFFGLIWFFVAHQGLQKGLRQITGSGFKKIIFFWFPNRRHKKQISTPVGSWRI